MRKLNIFEKILIEIGGADISDLDEKRIADANKKIPITKLWLIVLIFLLPILLFFILVK